MSFFGKVKNLDEVPDNPFDLPNDTYLCEIIDADHKPTAAGDKEGIIVKYQIIEGDHSNFFPFTEWLWTPDMDPDDIEDPKLKRSVEMAYSNLKKHFLSYGFGADELESVTPKDNKVPALIGRRVYLKCGTVKQKDGRKNVKVSDQISVEEFEGGLEEFAPSDDKPLF